MSQWARNAVRVRDGKLVELWPVQESLPLLEGLGAVVRVNAENQNPS